MTSKDFIDKMIAFCIHKRFIKDKWRGENFVSNLPGNPERIKEIFARSGKFDYPVLESISYWFHTNLNDNQLEILNKRLKRCGKRQISLEEINVATSSILGFGLIDNSEEPLDDPSVRRNIYNKIASSVTAETRLIAHFLLPFHEAHSCFTLTSEKPIHQILSKWTDITRQEERTWKYLKSILVFVGMKRLVNEVNKELGIEEELKEYEKTDDEEWHITVTKDSPQILTYTADEECYKNLPSSSLKRPEFIELLTSGNTKTTKISFDHYVRRSQKFLSDFFVVSNDVLVEKLRFPPEYMNEDEVAKVASLFEAPHNAVITHYDIIEHIKLFGIDVSEVCDHLNIDQESVGNAERRFLVCDLDKRSILNVRYTEATNENEALDDVKAGDKDLRFLLYLFEEQVMGTKCSVINVIAAPNIKEECKNELILNAEDLSPGVIRSKIRDLCKKVKMDETKEEEVKCKIGMTTVISLVFGFLAIQNIKNMILFASPSEKLGSIWLSSPQVKAVFNQNFWRVVTGGYGSGKSMVAKYLLQHLAKYASIPTDIYYVLLDSYSIFTEDMRTFCQDIMGGIDQYVPVNIIYGNAEEVSKKLKPYLESITTHEHAIECTISNILKALILKYQCHNNGERFHLIIDEVDGESLDKTQADDLREIFLHYGEMLKHSHVMFLMRSMEKRRMYISGKERKEYQSYHFYEQCGMEVLHLTKCMRNPKKVFDLVASVVSNVVGCPNIIYQAESAVESPLRKLTLQESADDKESQISSSNEDQQDHNEISVLLQPVADQDYVFENDALPDDPTEAPEDYYSENNLLSENLEVYVPNPNDIDAMAEDHNRRHNGSKHKIQTYFSYNACSNVHHHIEGQPPKMIFLNNDSDELSVEIVRKLSIVLDTLCFAEFDDKTTLIICNNRFELDLYANALDVLNRSYMIYYPELNIQQSFDKSKTGKLLLISDHSGSRGLEYEQVVVTLNPNDTIKWQYLVESMSRCTDQLILMVPYTYTERMVQSLQSQNADDVLNKGNSSCCWNFLKCITCNQNFDESWYWEQPFEDSEAEDKTIHNIILMLKKNRPGEMRVTTVSTKTLPGENFLLTRKIDDKTSALIINVGNDEIKKYTMEPVIQFGWINSTQTNNSCIGRPSSVDGFTYSVSWEENKLLLSWNKISGTCVIRSQQSSGQWEQIYRGNGINSLVVDIENGCRYNFKINAVSAVGSLESEESIVRFPPRSAAYRVQGASGNTRSRNDINEINEHIRKLNITLQPVHVRGAKEISAGKEKIERNISALQKCRAALLKYHGTKSLIKNIDKSITNQRMFLTSKLNTLAANERQRVKRTRRR